MKVPGKVHWNPELSTAVSASEVLPAMAADLFSAGRDVTGGKLKIGKLHDYRLLAKRFRYTVELFQPLYGPVIDERLECLRKLQQHLGKISDCAATRDLLKATAGKGRKKRGFKKVLAHIDNQERERVADFLKYWTEVFNAPGEEERWIRYLRDYAGRARKAGAA